MCVLFFFYLSPSPLTVYDGFCESRKRRLDDDDNDKQGDRSDRRGNLEKTRFLQHLAAVRKGRFPLRDAVT